MTDVHTRSQRTYNMSKIRSERTGPEKLLRSVLMENGYLDFEFQPKNVFGRPDFFFPKHRLAVFVDGCFWHGCSLCFQLPKTNRHFWKAKIAANKARDKKVNKELRAGGIEVLRVKEHVLKKDVDRVLKRIDSRLQQLKPLTVLDLFAGAGGLSEGFVRAGFDVVTHVEADRNACSTLTTRMLYHSLRMQGRFDEYMEYLYGKVSRSELIAKWGLEKERDSVICARIGKENYLDLIREVERRLNGRPLDVIVGGPPCQAYSYIGRSRDPRRMKRDDRNYLYRYYVQFLKHLQPKLFIFENVPGLLTAGNGRYLRHMRRLMARAGYTTDFKILNASDYGVPQNRKRVFLIGWNKDSGIESYPELEPVNRNYRVADFLSGLPKLKAGEGRIIGPYKKRNKVLQELGISEPWFGILMDHVARPHTQRDLEIYRRAVILKRKGENLKYDTLPSSLKTHTYQAGFLDRFRVVDDKSHGAHTVVAHIEKDGHYYIHPDLNQNRSLTVREAARLQTFPDDFKFEGSRGPCFRQIGNAVPPLLAYKIARAIHHLLSAPA